MKLKTFRIFYLVLLVLVTFLGIGMIIFTQVYNCNSLYTNTEMMMVNMLSYGVGIIFTFFQSYMVFKSFKYGTLLLNQICFDKERKRRVITGIISSLFLVLNVILFIFSLLARNNVLPNSNPDDYITYEFLFYYSSIIISNMVILITYYIFLRFDDLTSIK